NTLVLFLSDNGPSAEKNSYGLPGAKISRGILNGHKFSMLEGGIRVPCIIRWPQRISVGSIRDEVTTAMDIMPTLLEATGQLDEMSAKLVDGRTLMPLLRGHRFERSDTLHWENRYNMAVRAGDWKLVFKFWEDRPHLYHITEDPAEKNDRYYQEPERVDELLAAHERWKANYYPNPIPRQGTRPLNRIPVD